MLSLGFRYGIAELPHLGVDIGDGIPSRGELVQVQRQARRAVGEQKERDVKPARYADSEGRALILTELFWGSWLVPDRGETEGLGDLCERLGGGKAVYFLRVEAAKAHAQDFLDIAERAPQKVIGPG